MKPVFCSFFLLLIRTVVFAQTPVLKVGDPFPAVVLENMVNTPTPRIDLHTIKHNRLWIINFWGTWCSPCLPEMKQLAKLQSEKKGKLQIIGLSNDPQIKLQKYISNNPSRLWLSSDSSYLLYRMLQLASVGQAMIVDQNKKIVAIVHTAAINSQLVDSLLQNKVVHSNYETLEKEVNEDPFGIDSSTSHSLCVKGYIKGYPSMTKTYLSSGEFKKRRISLVNQTLPSLFRTAFDVKTNQQLILDSNTLDYKKIKNYSDKSQLYSIDIVIGKESSDSLYSILQYVLQTYTPIKARWEYKKLKVGILKATKARFINAPKTLSKEKVYSFSGNGYDGKAVTLKDFAEDYLANEFQVPVIDETGIVDRYDISTKLDLSDTTNLINSLSKLGLEIKKGERELPVLVLYK